MKPGCHPTTILFLFCALGYVSACSVFSSSREDDVFARGGGGTYKVGKPYEIKGRVYHPRKNSVYLQRGIASWYGPQFHGKKTANGEIYNMNALTAAHRTLPMPVYVRVKNLENGREVVLRVNDRGPFAKNRIIDVSRKAAERLGFLKKGTAKVEVRYIGHARSRSTLKPGGARAYYVQTAVFGDSAAALKMRARLRGILGGQGIVVRPADKNGKRIFRVLVGPFSDRDSADAIRAVLQANGMADVFIVRERGAS